MQGVHFTTPPSNPAPSRSPAPIPTAAKGKVIDPAERGHPCHPPSIQVGVGAPKRCTAPLPTLMVLSMGVLHKFGVPQGVHTPPVPNYKTCPNIKGKSTSYAGAAASKVKASSVNINSSTKYSPIIAGFAKQIATLSESKTQSLVALS